ncbi:hypothetical protein [Salmonella enterica]|nr:hypothetical protein [Salmonella enterica]ELO32385.1 hypothetical protein SEEE0316_22854 [Salmonella enterica subsp. enterica serovar Enteritidis str. 648903 1-6]
MAGNIPARYRKEISCVTLNLLKDGRKKMKSQLVAAADRAAMSVAYGQEAADHYGIQYGFIRSVRDWITGFTEGIKGERC